MVVGPHLSFEGASPLMISLPTYMPDRPSGLLEFSSARQVPLILQAEIAECGLASVAMVASYYGHKLDMAAMRKRFSANLKGMNLQQLIDLGDILGLASRALQCPIEDVSKLALPCILHWDMNHFVVLTHVNDEKVKVNDPALGKRILTLKEFAIHFKPPVAWRTLSAERRSAEVLETKWRTLPICIFI